MASTNNLEVTIRGIVEEAVGKALAAVRAHEGNVLSSVQDALDRARGGAKATPKRSRASGSQSAKPAKAKKAKRSTAKKGHKGSKRTKTTDVVGRIASILGETDAPLGIEELRKQTDFSDSQLRRALRLMVAEKLAKRVGENKATAYELSAKGRRAPRG